MLTKKELSILAPSVVDNKTYFPIVTVVGSYKFGDKMLQVQRELQELGCIVLMPIKLEYPGYSEYANNLSDKEIHDRHDQKMLMSDFVFCVNIGGFIGDHTQREIDFCKDNHIKIVYLEEVDNNGTT